MTEPGPYLIPSLAALAWANLELGDLAGAEEVTTRGMSLANEQCQQLHVPDVLRVHGMILTRQKKWEDAGSALTDAIRLSRTMHHPYGEGRAVP